VAASASAKDRRRADGPAISIAPSSGPTTSRPAASSSRAASSRSRTSGSGKSSAGRPVAGRTSTRTASPAKTSASAAADAALPADIPWQGPRPKHLASAVFVEGSVPLEPGTRYQLSVYGDDLRITGTTNSLPGGRILSRRLREIQMTSTSERLVIAGISERLADFRLVFDDVRNDAARDLPEELAALSLADSDAPGTGQ
jgi:hypothetical protein